MSDFEEIRAMLPTWIGWARPLVLVLFAFASSALAARVGAWVALPKRNTFEAAHWTERARMVHMLAAFPLGLVRPAIAAMGPLGIVAIYIPVVLVSLFASKTLRKMEERADGMAHDHIEDSEAYATALAKRAERRRPGLTLLAGEPPRP